MVSTVTSDNIASGVLILILVAPILWMFIKLSIDIWGDMLKAEKEAKLIADRHLNVKSVSPFAMGMVTVTFVGEEVPPAEFNYNQSHFSHIQHLHEGDLVIFHRNKRFWLMPVWWNGAFLKLRTVNGLNFS